MMTLLRVLLLPTRSWAPSLSLVLLPLLPSLSKLRTTF